MYVERPSYSTRLGLIKLPSLAKVMTAIDGTTFGSKTNTTIHNLSRALILHPIAAAITGIAFLLALCAHRIGFIVAALVAAVAFIVTLVALVIDFVMFAVSLSTQFR